MSGRIFRACLLLLTVALIVYPTIAGTDDFTLDSGGVTTLPAAGVVRVVVGNSSVINVQATENDTLLLVRAVGNGISGLNLMFEDGHQVTHTFRVTNTFPEAPADQQRKGPVSAAEVARLLDGVKGIEVLQVGSKVVIDGRILTEEDAERVDRVAKDVFGGGVIVLAKTDYQIMKQEENVLIEFQLVEINKEIGGEYGLKWSELLSSGRVELGASGQSGSRPQSYIRIDAGVDGFIQAMLTDGFGKVHDSHRVVTINNTEGQYFAGGELGFRTVSSESASVIYKEYGTKITAKPLVDHKGNVRITLKVESSALAGVGVDGVPNLTKKNVSSIIRMREDESLILSGLISRVGNEDVSRLPGLGQIPALGTLFSSKDFQDGESEAVIFITAKRLDAGDRENLQMIKQPQFRFREIDENWWERK